MATQTDLAKILIVGETIPNLPDIVHSITDAPKAILDRVTATLNKATDLHLHYNQYRLTVQMLEAHTDLTKSSDKRNHIRDMRKNLHTLYQKVLNCQQIISDIEKVQDLTKPSLPLPEDRPDNPNYNPEIIHAYLKSYVGNGRCTHAQIKELWKRAVYHADSAKLSRSQFIDHLIPFLPDDTFDYVRALRTQKKTVKSIAKAIAERYIPTDSFSDSLTELELFQRQDDETIHSALNRLRYLVSKATLLYPPQERPVHEKMILTQKLKVICSDKTAKKIKERETQARSQAVLLSPDDIAAIIAEEERLHGKPRSAISAPVTVYNIDTQELDDKDAQIESLNEFASQLLDENIQDDMVEINAAMRNVRFRDSSRDNRAPYGMKKHVADKYNKYQKQKLPIKHALTPSTLTQTHSAPAPHTVPLPDQDVEMTDADSSQSRHSRARTRDEDRKRRMNEFRSRHQSYDKYLRGKSQEGAEIRSRAMTPTSYLERRSLERRHRQLENENQYWRQQNEKQNERYNNSQWNRSPSQSSSYSTQRSGSKDRNYQNREQSADRGHNQRSHSGNRYNRSGSNQRSYYDKGYRPKSPGRNYGSAKTVVNTHDKTVVHICSKCGVEGEHTQAICHQILTRFKKKIQEN